MSHSFLMDLTFFLNGKEKPKVKVGLILKSYRLHFALSRVSPLFQWAMYIYLYVLLSSLVERESRRICTSFHELTGLHTGMELYAMACLPSVFPSVQNKNSRAVK